MLEIPLEYGLWTNLYMDYKNTIEGIIGVISQYEFNCNLEEAPENQPTKSVLSNEIINSEKQKNTLISSKETQVDILTTENNKLKITETLIDSQITEKNSQIEVINKALSNATLPLDCKIYEDKINEINTFDVESYCKAQVYGNTKTINTRDRELYNNCVKTENARLSSEKTVYSNLLYNCQQNNYLEEQLVVAKFENQKEVENTLVKDINVVKENINTLSKNYLVIGDETTQKSTLDNNDYINTINKTAIILGVTPKSITNAEGQIVLNDSQKVTLNIELQKNKT
jgi:hypothetical protein